MLAIQAYGLLARRFDYNGVEDCWHAAERSLATRPRDLKGVAYAVFGGVPVSLCG